jgi:hypothetical protein
MLRGGRLVAVAVVATAALLIAGSALVDLYVEVLWFRELGYASVFWTRTAWVWATRLVMGLVVAGALYLNLRFAARTLGGIQIKRRFGNLEISEQLPRGYVQTGMIGVSVLLGLWFGASVGEGLAEFVLLAAQGLEWGVTEPILGKDLSFYVFLLPLLQTGVTFLLITVFLVFTVCTGGYAATGAVRWGEEGVVMGNQPRIHLGVLVALFLLLLAAQFWLGRYALLQDGNSAVQGIFGYADATARLPALRILTVLTVFGALAVLYGTWQNRLVPALAGPGLVVVGGLLVTQLYPLVVQRFQVQPNELERETPFIEHNLAFTRMGFGLDQLERIRFEYDDSDRPGAEAVLAQVEGLPVWTSDALLTTFRELEARFPYYEFGSVDIDRYPAPGGAEPVAISAREINADGIPDPNWQNLHLRKIYVAGMGAVAAAATERTAEGRPEAYLSAIPPEFSDDPDAPPGLQLTRPELYVGSLPQRYAIINPSDSAYLRPDSSPGVPGVDFPRGISMDSPLRTLALALYQQDANLLFADEVSGESRMIMRRRVVDRVRRIAPFLRFPETPYPVIHDVPAREPGGESESRIVWILEGFTSTRSFPLAASYPLEFRGPASYVRNSVKVTVDAVTGEVTFYDLPEEDPLLEAYGRAFPGLLTPFEAMPADLRRHVRYSKRMLSLQASVLLQYHQNSAPVFHGQQDVWNLASEQARSTSPISYVPEYGRYRLPDDEEDRFYLTTVFVPQGRQNLTATLAGTLGPDGMPELTLFDVPVEDQVAGPRQVEALVEQDPIIAQQLSLWRQGGSQVWTGHLHLVPVGKRLFYMEPIFLAAEADAIPELRRFVVSDGRRVAMEPSLEDAVAVLVEGEAPTSPPPGEDPAQDVPPRAPGMWPTEALDLLDQAEERLRSGDWEGFGRSLGELRSLLRDLSASGSAGAEPGGPPGSVPPG